MTKSIFVTRKIPDIAIKILKDKGYMIDVNEEDKILSKDDLIQALSQKQYDAVLCLLTDHIDKDIFEVSPNTKIFSNYAMGFDNLDLIEAKNRGVLVANAPGDLSAVAVAQHTISFIMALASKIFEANSFVHQGKYDGWEPMSFLGSDLSNKFLGIVGVGRIGERVANYAKNLGMNIIYVNSVRNEKFEKDYSATFCSSIDELLPQVDFVTFHVPLLPATKHMLNNDNLKLMKKNAFVINTSRGPVLDELALTQALADKTIAGAALDVFEFEPKITSGLLSMPNVILTPHIASSTIEARNQMAEIAAENIVDFFEGKEVKNIVNK